MLPGSHCQKGGMRHMLPRPLTEGRECSACCRLLAAVTDERVECGAGAAGVVLPEALHGAPRAVGRAAHQGRRGGRGPRRRGHGTLERAAIQAAARSAPARLPRRLHPRPAHRGAPSAISSCMPVLSMQSASLGRHCGLHTPVWP